MEQEIINAGDQPTQKAVINEHGIKVLVSTEYIHEKLLSIDDVVEKVTMCKSSIYKLIRKGEFPKGRKIGNGKNGLVRWYEYDVLHWIKERLDREGE